MINFLLVKTKKVKEKHPMQKNNKRQGWWASCPSLKRTKKGQASVTDNNEYMFYKLII